MHRFSRQVSAEQSDAEWQPTLDKSSGRIGRKLVIMGFKNSNVCPFCRIFPGMENETIFSPNSGILYRVNSTTGSDSITENWFGVSIPCTVSAAVLGISTTNWRSVKFCWRLFRITMVTVVTLSGDEKLP